MKPIKTEDLEHGAYYAGTCRNAQVARWNAQRKEFVHWRTKYGHKFAEVIRNEGDDARYDTFAAHYKLEQTELAAFLTVHKEIPLEVM